MNTGDDPYDVLKVDSKASLDEIKKSYRKLALKYHPDRNGGDAQAQATFAKISNAYEILSDPAERQNYDLQQNHGQKGFDPNGARFTNCSDDYDPTNTSSSSTRSASPQGSSTTFSQPFRTTTTWSTSEPQERTSTYTTNKTGGNPNKTKKKTFVSPSCSSGSIPIDPHSFQDPFELFRQHFGEEAAQEMFSDPSFQVIGGNGGPVRTTTAGSSSHMPPKDKKKKKKKKSKMPTSSKLSSSPNKNKNMTTVGSQSYPKPTGSMGMQSCCNDGNDNDDDDDGIASMSSSTRTVTHPNGQTEIITETVIQRFDGSTETKSESQIIVGGGGFNTMTTSNNNKRFPNRAGLPLSLSSPSSSLRSPTTTSSTRMSPRPGMWSTTTTLST